MPDNTKEQFCLLATVGRAAEGKSFKKKTATIAAVLMEK